VRHLFGVAACLALGFFGVIEQIRVPILADVTYGLHALGHLLTWFLPDTYGAMMGSAFQVFIPLAFAGYFLLFHRDLLGVSLMLGWTGCSAGETSAYIADAVTQTIVPGPGHAAHDWALSLGALGKLGAVEELAFIVQAFAIVCILVGMGVAAWGAVRALMEHESVERAESYLERRPTFDSPGYDQWAREHQVEGQAPPPPAAS
jgi:hypothetical protein